MKWTIEITGDAAEVSDGFHTFTELYDHRITLWIALCRAKWRNGHAHRVWRSRKHSDGMSISGWFLLGLGTAKGHQITYHLPEKHWEETHFADEFERAPEWDGHTSADVLERLKSL